MNENNNLQYWNKLSAPPSTALKPIEAGRLKGKSDINPQWRYQAMTETFGPCGIGWRYEITRLWTEPATGGQVFAFAQVQVFIRHDGEWSAAIPGIGGSMLIEQERNGLHDSDEGFKMAVTDALSVALKMIGVAGEVYLGNYDGSKYRKPQGSPTQNHTPAPQQQQQKPAPQSAELTPKHAEYQERIKTALKAIFGDDRKAALDEVERLTAFKGKDGNEVAGKRDFTKLSEKASSILCHNLEKRLADMQGSEEPF